MLLVNAARGFLLRTAANSRVLRTAANGQPAGGGSCSAMQCKSYIVHVCVCVHYMHKEGKSPVRTGFRVTRLIATDDGLLLIKI